MDAEEKANHLQFLDSLDLEELLERSADAPDDVDLIVRIAGAYFKQRRFDEARQFYERAI